MNCKVKQFLLTTAIAALLTGGWLPAGTAAEAGQTELTIKEIMKKGHKGDNSLIKHVTSGKGTPAEIKQLLAYYTAMPKLEPAKGDAASWKEKTGKLLAATQNLDKGTPGALEAFKAAVNCKSCHTAHKPD